MPTIKIRCDCRDILQLLHTINGRLDTMATQTDIDALTAQLATLSSDLSGAVAGIQADLDALKAANPAVDITALQASVASLSTVVASAQAVDAENPPAA